LISINLACHLSSLSIRNDARESKVENHLQEDAFFRKKTASSSEALSAVLSFSI
jgi:hypothetical protein